MGEGMGAKPGHQIGAVQPYLHTFVQSLLSSIGICEGGIVDELKNIVSLGNKAVLKNK